MACVFFFYIYKRIFNVLIFLYNNINAQHNIYIYIYIYTYKCTCRRTAGNTTRPSSLPSRWWRRRSKSMAAIRKMTLLQPPPVDCRLTTVSTQSPGNPPPDIPMGSRCFADCCVGGSPDSVKSRWLKKVSRIRVL